MSRSVARQVPRKWSVSPTDPGQRPGCRRRALTSGRLGLPCGGFDATVEDITDHFVDMLHAAGQAGSRGTGQPS